MDIEPNMDQYRAIMSELIELGVQFGLGLVTAVIVLIVGSLLAK